MSTDTTLEIVSSNADNTFAIGELIGRNLRGGECIDLQSDLGGGKTVLVRGLAKGIGSNDQVASPTFTISRHYKNDNELIIYHYDFYRLADSGVMQHEVQENLTDKQGVVVIEWSGVVQDILPQDKLTISITATGENTRLLQLIAASQHSHLLQGVQI